MDMLDLSEPKSAKLDERLRLLDMIAKSAQAAFDPSESEKQRHMNQPLFYQLIERIPTIHLMPALSHLVKPDKERPWLKTPLLQVLTRLPIRPRGVQDAIEFILSAHARQKPLTSNRNGDADGGRGSAISHEALNYLAKLFSLPAKDMSPDEWFATIAPQLFDLLDGRGQPEMDRTAAYIIGFGILGLRQYGLPGTPGWKAFVDPIYQCLDPSLVSKHPEPIQRDEDIVTIGAPNILISSTQIRTALSRLTALVMFHPNPSLTKRLLGPIILPLWTIASWHSIKPSKIFCDPATNLLKIFLRLSSASPPTPNQVQAKAAKPASIKSSHLFRISQNILFKGKSDPTKLCWEYATSESGKGIQINKVMDDSLNSLYNIEVSEIQIAVSEFVSFLKDTPDIDPQISELFLHLGGQALPRSRRERAPPGIQIRGQLQIEQEDIQRELIESILLQEMVSSIPTRLISNSKQALHLVNDLLSDFASLPDDQADVAMTALSLLHSILASPGFRRQSEIESTLRNIEQSLHLIGRMSNPEVSEPAQQLSYLLKFGITIDQSSATSTDIKTEEQKSYRLALSYLTDVGSPPPVRAQGLEIISSLMSSQSSALDIPALLVLFSSLLQDKEEYIYLRSIKCFIQLSHNHPKAVMKDLIERYVDLNENSDIDARLKFGEALVQVIQTSANAFSGDVAGLVVDGLLCVASRRGRRPKTEEEQNKREKLNEKKNQEAEEAWDGPVPQLDELEDEAFDAENEYLSQIVSGWASKKGVEDVRIRASALAILGSGIEANVAGVRSNLLSFAVDFCTHILVLERGPEKAILRRSAIILIMSFIRSLENARTEGRRLPFELVGDTFEKWATVLFYVEENDNDEMVKGHAKDVREALHTWQMNVLLPTQNIRTGIEELAGLSINPGGGLSQVRQGRIEEIE